MNFTGLIQVGIPDNWGSTSEENIFAAGFLLMESKIVKAGKKK
jgi:hypothetical protein